MNPLRILVAGIGNVFLGDDGFGVEVAQRLAARPQPEGVRVVDFGIRGFDLAFALVEGWDAAILVDAVPRPAASGGGAEACPPLLQAGALYVIEPELESAGSEPVPVMIETHAMDPVKVLRLASNFGALPEQVLVVGCEPESFGSEDDMRMSLSPPVQAAVGEAVSLVESLITRFNRHAGMERAATG